MRHKLSLCNICTYLLHGMNDPRGGKQDQNKKGYHYEKKDYRFPACGCNFDFFS